MCWSGEASAVLAVIGLSTTAYAAYKGEPKALWLTLGYFTLMEVLQAFTYIFIDQCGHPWNQVLTLLGYLHIAFQPIFGCMFAFYFVPKHVRRTWSTPVYALCFASAIFMLIQLYPFAWAGGCRVGSTALCGNILCSISGSWHIAWLVPFNGLTNIFHPFFVFPTYLFTMFALPLLFGAWKVVLYHLLAGPVLAYLLTDNWNEWPAVWCLLSIAFLLVVVKTPLRQYLHTKRWFFYDDR